MLSINSVSHRRFNPLTREWVLVSPHRTVRPWQGQVEKGVPETLPPYAPDCYLCPGNLRAGGVRNPQYSSTFVFANDFPALQQHMPEQDQYTGREDLVLAVPEKGICRVGCFSPRHDITLGQMTTAEIEQVIDMWIRQSLELGSLEFVNYVQIFENRGAMMGASNPHPHCQIWATQSVPDEPAKEQLSMESYSQEHNSCLLCDYMQYELQASERLVFENEAFIVLVPFWAVWPFETLLISRHHVAELAQLGCAQRAAMAGALKRLISGYDHLFDSAFPYSMGFHSKPVKKDTQAAHLHAHFYPPLLRSATVRKFMVGFEMLGTPQRDFTPESAAERLRDASRERAAE
jgi:UDPglucose--hexose-1-phosphate uridylyltransferase